MMRTQTNAVLMHLKNHGHITSMEAIHLYRATRLSDIILRLRTKYEIETVMKESAVENEYGRKSRYAEYVYKGEKNV